jgi:His-Xaa-Ser system radical SAM maturase HxsC
LYKVLGIAEALQQQFPLSRVLIDIRHGPEVDVDAFMSFGIAGIVSRVRTECEVPQLYALSIEEAIGAGDVIRVQPSGQVNVLYRRGANANSLFVTERCNSLCLMCSQPPRQVDDSWRVGELIDLLPLIDQTLDVLGVTGGEPTLLGPDLQKLLGESRRYLPATHIHVLTNCRSFSDPAFADQFDGLRGHATWAVPLYADVARIHDEVVQAPGAFVETMNGLHNLAERGHLVEIRTVLHARTLPRILNWAHFLYRNLPFARHAALMGLEPMGLARGNASLLETNPSLLSAKIAPAVSLLNQAGMNVSIYNVPLCSLEPALWPFARKSISDWKNEYASACAACAVKGDCCGFFKSASASFRDTVARPLRVRAA